jgi:hypothetical protein
MNIDDDTERFIIHRLKWSALFMCAGIILVFLLPFPLDFISVLGLLILVNFLRGRSVMKRYGGMGRIKDMFGSLSSDSSQYSRVKYYCMSCGKEHNDVACPSCGSKMKKVG